MKINIITIFPELINSFLNNAILQRALTNKSIEISIIDLRNFTSDKHKKVDDYGFGGNSGMVIKAEPFFNLFEDNDLKNIVYASPQGVKLNNVLAKELSAMTEITIICGHYEGIDERVIEKYVDLEISIGDYVLSGGELPSLVILDAILRFIPNFISKNSYENDSFEDHLLDHAVYTRPDSIEGMKVPDVLLSGNHQAIEKYRKQDKLYRTLIKRSDLIKTLDSGQKQELIEELQNLIQLLKGKVN